MRHFILVSILLLVLTGCTTQQPERFSHDVVTTETPWTHQSFDANADGFTFAIVSDLWGGYRDGIFDVAAVQVNQLRPEFVLSVGDLIDGGSEERSRLHQEWDVFDGLAAKINAPFFFAGGNHDLTNVLLGYAPCHSSLQSRKRNDEGIVLIATKAGLPFAGKHTNDLHGDIADSHFFPDRVCRPEQCAFGGRTDHGYRGTVRVFFVRKESALRQLPVANAEVI